MKLFLDHIDLEHRLTRILMEEGIGVDTLTWGQDSTGSPTLEITIGDPPEDMGDPLSVTVARLEEALRVLQTQVGSTPYPHPLEGVEARLQTNLNTLQHVVQEMSPSVSPSPTPPTKGRRGRPPGPSNGADRNFTGRMAAAVERDKEDAKYIGHPLGAELRKGERRLAPNESEEFPK